MPPLIEVDLRRLDRERPRGLSAYALPLMDALFKLDGTDRYQVLEPGSKARVSGTGGILLSFDGGCLVSRSRISVVLVPDLGHLSARHAYSWGEWIRQSWSVAWAARRADHLLTPSQAVAGELHRYQRVPGDRITVIPAASVLRRAPRTEVESLRRRLDLPDRYFLYVGSERGRKNLGLLLRAWQAALPSLEPGLELVLAGDGGPGTQHPPDSTPRCRRLPYLPDQQLAALLSGAIAWLNPSFYEGSGLGALEAMACGTPPVVAATGAQPEVVGSAGIILSPTDHLAWAAAIALLAREPDVRARLSRHAREGARRVRLEDSAAALLEALDRASTAVREPGGLPAGPEGPGPGSQPAAAAEEE